MMPRRGLVTAERATAKPGTLHGAGTARGLKLDDRSRSDTVPWLDLA